MSDAKTRIARYAAGQAANARGSNVRLAKATTRDVHPTRGSAAILQAAASGVREAHSMNVRRADGSSGTAFFWDVEGFGWDEGEFE